MSLLKPAANAVICLALIGLSVIGVAALSGIGHRWVDILAQFTAPALLVAVTLTILTFVFRLWASVLTGATAMVILVLAVWPQWLPTMGRPQPDQPIIRVYSSNMFLGNQTPGAMRASIVEADADIVMMVEVGDLAIAHLDNILAGYPHRAVLERNDEVGGRAFSVIASRFPISQRFPGRFDGLSTIGVVVETSLGPVNVFATHLTRPWPYQYQWGQITQVMALTSRFEDAPKNPTIIAGDFNSVSSARIGRQIKDDMGLIPAPGYPGTWPGKISPLIGMTIDQVYRTPDLALISRRIGTPTGSDHHPVVTEFTRAVVETQDAPEKK